MKRRDVLKTGLFLGLATTTGVFTIQACKKAPKIDWDPVFFSEDDIADLRRIVDQFIPKTDQLPSASSVGVLKGMDDDLAFFTDAHMQTHFRDDMTALRTYVQETFGKPIRDLNEEDMKATMDYLLDQAKNPTDDEIKPFFVRLKRLTFNNYMGSKEIVTNYLNYDPIPGEYRCIDVSEANNIIYSG